MMFVKILFVGLIVGVEFSSTSRIGKWLPLNSKRSLLRDLMYPHKKHVMNHRGIGRYAQTELVIGSTSGTIGQDEQECLRDHHVTIWNAESQAGTYYKRICQQNRSVPSAISPTDIDDPTIKTSEVDPQFKLIKEGYSVTLMCNVNTSSSFEWIRTKPTDKFKYIDSTTRNNQFEITENIYQNISELTIRKITYDDSGTYVCKATRLDEQVMQRFEYELQTLVAPTITDIKVNNVSIGTGSLIEYKESTPLTMSCEANGAPTPYINWRNATSRKNGATYLNASAVFIFPNLTWEQSGDYICNAWNNAGEVNRTITLSVLYKPVITTTDEQDIRCGMDEQVPIFCDYKGNPIPNKTTWYKDGVVLSSTDYVFMTDESFLFKIKSKKDYGNYTCEVSNSLGKASRVYSVSGRPRMPNITSGNTTQKRTEYHLHWKSNDHYVVITHFIVRVVQVSAKDNNYLSGDLEVQRILYSVTSRTKHHYSLHIQALRPLTTYRIYVKPFADDVTGDEASITMQTPLEDYVTQMVTASCSGSSTQPKVDLYNKSLSLKKLLRQQRKLGILPQKQGSSGNGVDMALISPTLVLTTLLMSFLVGCM